MTENFEFHFGHQEKEYAGVSPELPPQEQELDYIIENTRSKRLDLEDFIDTHGRDVIAKDRAKVEELEKKFNAEWESKPEPERTLKRISRKRGEALEIIISEQTELSDWLGPDAMTQRTTKYDDYKNKVDLVVEFNPEYRKKPIEEKDVRRLALAIDASDDPETFTDKMRLNQDKITGRLDPARVKYFQSQVTDYRGQLNPVLPVVIGLEGKNIQNLLHLESRSLRGAADSGLVNKRLADHPVQRVFIEEILAQLEWYKKLLEGKEATGSKYKREDIENLSEMMEKLLKKKKSIYFGLLEGDRVMQKIKKIVK